ncbi:uncharacterized protein KY384_004903 [Bacidia gigantensis]|uniref:uncharacterized protein n=1 Tax=Bacidia gigantensis TaxID=2732470 RepID=UPI001D03B75C|nr:uncharacterized protein KY384_004903 [Bacidia gigantensis]KAG8530401.1 hypothetical protein KY384_004903 [Bacidia gigantensis]
MSAVENVAGGISSEAVSVKNQILETGASIAQTHRPWPQGLRIENLQADVITISSDVRQCLIYESPVPNARLIGIEYMITPKLYGTLLPEERKLWHSHVYEVKSGMLIMPGPNLVPNAAWEVAETKEMEEVIGLYGKTYHFWQVDRGDKLPLGGPELMMSFTEQRQGDVIGLKEIIQDRDERYAVSSEEKAKKREYIEEPKVHKDADSVWKEEPTGASKLTGKIRRNPVFLRRC